jgi:TonB family protein
MRLPRFCVILFLIAFHPFFSIAQNPDSNGVYQSVEQMPEYPGGLDSLVKEITARVIYPEQCVDSNIQGKVYIQFIVNEDGRISGVHAVRGPHSALNKAAEEATIAGSKFKPGMHNGMAVKVYSTIPIVFKLKADSSRSPVIKDLNCPEKIPEFPGGEVELIMFIRKSIKYPKDALNKEVEGKVLVRFTVIEDGSVTDIEVTKSIFPSLDNEAVRIAGTLPKFKPGMQNCKPVKVYFTLPVIFKLP